MRVLAIALLVACGSSSNPTPDPDAPTPDVEPALSAEDGSFTTLVDVQVSGTLQGASNVDAPFIYRVVELPASGTFQLIDDTTGAFTYTPGSVGVIETVKFKVTDLTLESNVAIVTLKVNSAATNALVVDGPTTNTLPSENLDPDCQLWTVTRRGDVAYLASATTVQITAPANTVLFPGLNCSISPAPTTEIAIPAGQHSVTFIMRVQVAGTANLEFIASGFASATHTLTTIAGFPATITVAKEAASPCRKITATFTDHWGNATSSWHVNNGPPPLGLFTIEPVNGNVNPISFFKDSQCTNEFTNTMLNGGKFYDLTPASQIEFFVRTSGPANLLVGFTAPGFCDQIGTDICGGIALEHFQ